MKKIGKDNIYDLLQTLLGSDHEVNILQEEVGVETQLAYFDHVHKKGKALLPGEVLDAGTLLSQENLLLADIKDVLVCLALTPEVKAYRILERFAASAEGDMRSWATMAFQENRVHLETSLGEQPRSLISSGLGGEGNRLRYFVVMIPALATDFTLSQKEFLEKEVKYCLQQDNSLMEEVVFYDGFACLSVLIPLNIPLPELFHKIIDSCNFQSKFLSEKMIITNVKRLDEIEVRDIIAKGM